MKIIIVLFFIIAFQNCIGQTNAIPECFQTEIDQYYKENKRKLFKPGALFKIKSQEENLYYLAADYGNAQFVRMPHFTYKDENCNEKYNSKDQWAIMRKMEVTDTLWIRPLDPPLYDMSTFLNSKRKFIVKSFKEKLPHFKLKENQKIAISLKEGLQVYSDNKLSQTYKLEPIDKIQYHYFVKKVSKADAGICNAVLLKHMDEYWLLLINQKNEFELLSSDERGNVKYNQQIIRLQLLD